MENKTNADYEQDSHTAVYESSTPDYQNSDSNKGLNQNPNQENDNSDDDKTHLYPDQNRNSLNSDSVFDPLNEEDIEEDKEDDDDFNKEDFEEEGDFEEKDIDYREKKERDSF